jgi:hypothetical protein
LAQIVVFHTNEDKIEKYSKMKVKPKKLPQAKHHHWQVRNVYSKFCSNLFSSLKEISWSQQILAQIFV